METQMSDPRLDITPLRSEDADGEVARVLSKLEASGNNLKILRVLANGENVFRPFVLLSNALMNKSSLSAADREVVILHLAAQRDVPYEWKEHVPMSDAVGITEDQRKLILSGTIGADDFTPSQLLAVRAADEIISGRSLSEATWAQARDTWGQDGALDLVVSVAWWGAFVPTIIEAIGLQDPAS
jgi:alkylhydroperoxidase family enzyme